MKILILEPHGDDALLSCYDLLKSDEEIFLMTFSERGSDSLQEKMPSIKYSEYMDYPNLWFRDGKSLLKSHEVHRDYNNGVSVYYKYLKTLMSEFGEEFIRDVEQVSRRIAEIMYQYDPDVVVCPVGLSHPYHVVVREAWNSIKCKPTLYYVDKYYIQTRYNKEIYQDFLRNNSEYREYNPGYEPLPESRDEIASLLKECYPTESMLLRFYSDIILNYPCKYVYEPNNIVERLLSKIG